MSQNPKSKAGEKIVSGCPFCLIEFDEQAETRTAIECPNPSCNKTFTVW